MRIQEVTKKLKLSTATISRALNPATKHLVAEKTRKRIEHFVKKAGYVPNKAARQLITGQTFTIGVVLPTVFESIYFNDHMTKVLAGVYRVLSERSDYQCKLMVLPRGESLTKLDEETLSKGVDGLLLSSYCDHAIYSSHYFPSAILKKLNKPTIALNLEFKPKGNLSCVYFSHFQAARQAVIYLIQKGHKKIGLIKGNQAFLDMEQRFKGYKSALKDHGLNYQEELVSEGDFLFGGGYEATLQLMKKSKSKPTAIFSTNDEMALGALSALRNLGIECPGEVAVIGFDGIDAGEYSYPKLTSLKQPTEIIAETATRHLLNILAKKEDGPLSHEVPSELIIRSSA